MLTCPAASLSGHSSGFRQDQLPSAEQRRAGKSVSHGAFRLLFLLAFLFGLTPTTAFAQTVNSVSVAPTFVRGGSGNTVTGTVMLTSPAGAAGITVSLNSSAATAASVPGNVTLTQGMISKTFTVTTYTVTTPISVIITASYNGANATTTLTVNPLGPQTISFSPGSTVTGGSKINITVTLNGPAPVGGLAVALS